MRWWLGEFAHREEEPSDGSDIKRSRSDMGQKLTRAFSTMKITQVLGSFTSQCTHRSLDSAKEIIQREGH